MHYKIKQLNKRTDYRFMHYDYAEEHGLNLDDYDVVYEGETKDGEVNSVLEDLFAEFNVNPPEDFRGHSLSTSDVVELDGKNYYCDWAGWVEIKRKECR